MPLEKLLSALALVLICSANLAGFAAAKGDEDPIDKRCEQCIDKDSSTAGMVNCAEKAQKEWDAELNKAYQKLMKQLPAAQKAALRSSQQNWIKFRDSEFAIIDKMYDSMSGTMYIPMHVEARTRVIRERVKQLRDYHDLIDDNAK